MRRHAGSVIAGLVFQPELHDGLPGADVTGQGEVKGKVDIAVIESDLFRVQCAQNPGLAGGIIDLKVDGSLAGIEDQDCRAEDRYTGRIGVDVPALLDGDGNHPLQTSTRSGCWRIREPHARCHRLDQGRGRRARAGGTGTCHLAAGIEVFFQTNKQQWHRGGILRREVPRNSRVFRAGSR